MTPPPLAILQVRMGSSRLPGKAMLPLAGKPIVQHCVERARAAFGAEHVIAAIPDGPEDDALERFLHGLDVPVVRGSQNDVLLRFWVAAHRYRWTYDAVIVRVTCDDPFKDPAMMRRVAEGERLPVEFGAEAFTLDMLDVAHEDIPEYDERREHLTRALFPTDPPPAPPGVWTVDTREQYEAACAKVSNDTPNSHPRTPKRRKQHDQETEAR